MRDYNTIKFRSPKNQQQQTVSSSSNSNHINKDHSSTSPLSNNTTTTTSSTSSFRNHPQQQQYHHHPFEEEKKCEQMSKDSQSTANLTQERSLSPIPPPMPPIHHGTSNHHMSSPTPAAPASPPLQHSFSSRTSGIPPPSSSRSPQQHHHSSNRSSQQQQQSNSTTMNNNTSHAGSLNTSGSSQLSATDALAVRREGAENTIVKLRNALDDSSQKDTQSKTALAKSDAVILELRSSVRQLKRQLDRVQDEKNAALKAKQAALEKMQSQQQSDSNNMSRGSIQQQQQADNDSAANAANKHAQDLQMQLDRAHAQILTADMVRKELEDTLEAEQYTWELRVQDQERQIAELQQDCATLVNDLEAVRNQWKSGQEQQDSLLEELQSKLQVAQDELARYKQRDDSKGQQQDKDTTAMADQVADLQQKLQALEQERAELQACLDEALKELEAVDAELQQGDAANGQANAQLRAENENLQRMLREQHAATAILEPLTQLHRLVLARDGVAPDRIEAAIQSITVTNKGGGGKNGSSKQPTRDAQQVIAAIRLHLDQVSREKQNSPHHHSDELDKDLAATRNQVRELQAQISVYKGDLMAREESSAELRTSLKEAVSLLKPLQDAVAKADREKSRMLTRIEDLQKRAVPTEAEQLERKKLRDELMQKDKEIDTLKHQVDHLEVQLTKAKAMAASGLIAANRSPVGVGSAGAAESPIPLEGESKARAKLRAKRAEEQQLKQLLRDAQSRFKSLHQQNAEVESKNVELQGRLKTAGNDGPTAVAGIEEHQELMHTLQEREKALEDMESELKVSKGELAKKAVEMRTLERDLEQARLDVSQQQSSVGSSAGGADPAVLAEAKKRVQYLERKLVETDKNLRNKRETERSLNRSLKEALNLLRPLQMHLEEAEREKRELSMELRNLKTKLGGAASPDSNDPAKGGDSVDMAHVKELEYAVRQLEKENSQLHDALEDLSHSVNASRASAKSEKAQQQQAAQLRKEMGELKSHHELTQSRLEDAFVENHSLVEALKKREMEESQMAEEVNVLRQELQRAEAQLQQHQQQEHGSTPQNHHKQQQQQQSQLGRFKQQQQVSSQQGNRHRGQR